MSRQSEAGFTLVELLVTSFLGAILLLALSHFVLQTRQLSHQLAAVDQLTDQQRLSWLLVQRDIQMAGFQSCIEQQPSVIDDGAASTAQQPVLGWEALGTAPGEHWQDALPPTWQGSHGLSLPTRLRGQLVPGSDVLVLHQAVRIPLTQWLSLREDSQTLSLRFAESTGVRYGETVLLADLSCQYIAQLTQMSRQGHTLTIQRSELPAELILRLQRRASEQLQLLSWQTQAYYVGFAQDHWSLYRRRLDRSSAVAEELIRGVLTQQVLYGEPYDSGLRFQPAHEVQHWPNVRALHWGLLLADSGQASANPEPVLGVRGWDGLGQALHRSFRLRQLD